jgi:hypothetical protein
VARVLRFLAMQRRFEKAWAHGPTAKEHTMQVSVETQVDDRGIETLRRFRLDGRDIEVTANIDQWHGADHRYFKVSGGNGDIYILRVDDVQGEWELTMYQRARSEEVLSSLEARGRPLGRRHGDMQS